MSRKPRPDPSDTPATTRLTLSAHIAQAAPPADKHQAKLQRLIQQIEAQRGLLQEWRDYEAVFRERVRCEIVPLEEKCREYRRGIVFALDAALKTRGLLTGKVQQRQAKTLIAEMSRDLLDESPDAELEALHDQYSNLSHAEWTAGEEAMQQELMTIFFGDEAGDDDDEETPIFSRQTPPPDQPGGNDRPPEVETATRRARPKSKREIATEKLAREASQSVRQVFRKLASTLHPDRESDPAERERKTILMQRVNDAYARNDLLGLLTLQFEIEQIDTEHLSTLDAERTQQYLHVFTGQLKELKQEIAVAAAPYRQLLRNYSPSLRPRTVDRALAHDLALLRNEAERFRRNLAQCQDKTRLKSWLKAFYEAALLDDPDF